MSEEVEFINGLIEGFLEDAPQLLETVEKTLSALEKKGPDSELAETLVQALHTLRNQANFLEFDSFCQVARSMERLVERVQQGSLAPAPPLFELWRKGCAQLAAGLEQLRRFDRTPLAVEALLAQMSAAQSGGSAAGDGTAPPPEAQVAAIRIETAEEDLRAQAEDETEVSAEETVLESANADAAAGKGALVSEESDPAIEAALAQLEDIEVQEGPIGEEVAEFVPDFITEAAEILDKLDEDLVRLEEAGDDLELLNEIFRAAHTLKGTSSFLGFVQMADLTHKMENVLDLLRKGEMELTQDIVDIILQSVDQIKLLQGDIRNNLIVRRDMEELRRALLIIAATRGGEVAVSRTPRKEKKPASAPARSAPAQVDQVIRVDVERIDKIMTLSEELVLGRNRLLQLNTQLLAERGDDELVNRLNEATRQVNDLTGELQESVMRMRMIPISRVFSRFPRLVRDLARDLDKQIELVIEDRDTEMDKSVADQIGDPLVHLIRNAVDHGIEAPEERRRAGKQPRGTVLLSAEHEGNHIVIRIRDDGHGMDPEKLKRKAVEKGLLDEEEAERMDEAEAYNLIFAPGFSTAQQITGVSGRGVGMDVVKTNITRLSGTIELESALGEGTEITIRLPLTLAIINGLQVSVGEEIFVVPVTAVIEALKIAASDIESLRGRKVIMARDKVLPLIDLHAALEIDGEERTKQSLYVVVAALAERRVGILVDRLLGQVDVVIKALGELVGPARGIAGATILGDGRVRLILDVGELMDMAQQNRAAPAPGAALEIGPV